MDLVDKHPEVLLRQFDNEIDKLKEEIRVMKERSDLCFSKIKSAGAEEVKIIKSIKADAIDFNYEKASSDVARLIELKERTELPNTNILYTIIYNHSANIQAAGSRVASGTAIYQYHQEILAVLQLRINNLKQEIQDMNTALGKGLPLEYLSKLNAEEVTEHALDRKLGDIRSKAENHMHALQIEALDAILSLEKDIKEFEKVHPTITNTAEKTARFLGLLAKVNGYVTTVYSALKITSDFIPGASAATGIVSLFSAVSTSASLTMDIMERSKQLNKMILVMSQAYNAGNVSLT